jgi:hypothetical protein
MNTRVSKFMLLTLVLFFIVAEVSHSQTLTAVDSFPSPSTIPFGLEWINGYLWHSDRASRLIYKINPTTHDTIRSFRPGVYDPAGLAWNGSQLFCADWTRGKIFRIDTTNGAALDSFPSPNGSPFGLTWDGNNLWCTEVFAGRLCKLDSSGTIIQYFQYPYYLIGLTFDGTQFWVSAQEKVVNGSRKLYRISTSGDTLASYQPPGPYAEDIAWDGSHLWICHGGINKIFKMLFTPTEVVERKFETPALYSLNQNWPNPFNPSTTISYQLSTQSHVTLKVFDVLGKEVATLVNENKKSGSYEVEFDGSKLMSGIYFYRLQTGNHIETKKLLLLK